MTQAVISRGLGLTLILVLLGCQSSQQEDDLSPLETPSSSNGRLQLENKELLIISPTAFSRENDGGLKLKLISSVSGPEINGLRLQATDLSYSDKKLLVSYAVAGEVQMGALDYIDVSKSEEPELLANQNFYTMDVNAVAREGSDVYVVGASSSLEKAALAHLVLKKDQFIDEINMLELQSFAGTDVAVSSKKVYALDGDRGGLKQFEKNDLSVEVEVAIQDARGLALDSKKQVHIFSGQSGWMRVVDEYGNLLDEMKVGGANTPESKSTIEVGKTLSLVSVGEEGARLVCMSGHKIVADIEPLVTPSLDPALSVTNAATLSNGLLFTANGEGGVRVYSVKEEKVRGSDCPEVDVALLGSIDFGSGFSANQVLYRDGILFVATGKGGLKIVKVYKDEEDDDCRDFD